jgi:tetratricopeptide (TPR) repeat protein
MAKSSGSAGSSRQPAPPPNVAASRTLDSVARRAPQPPPLQPSSQQLQYGGGWMRASRAPHERMWPAQGWKRHALVVLTIAIVALAAYSNSFTAGWTLDNKYIIELDPRTKAETWGDIPPEPGKPSLPGKVNIWTKDYWWPKGISGLYRPIVTWTYWFNWHVIGGDENRIDPNVQREVVGSVPVMRRVQILQALLAAEGGSPPAASSSDPDDQARSLRDALAQTILSKLPAAVRTEPLTDRKIDDKITDDLYNQIDIPTRIKALRPMIGEDPDLDKKLSTLSDVVAQERLLRDTIRERTAAPMMSWRLAWFHVINYLAHVGVAVLIYLVGLTLTQRFWVSAAMGLLFTTHPIATESVTNTIGRADIFAAITVMGGLLLYIRSTKSPDLWKLPWLVGLMLLTMFGQFSKESAVAIIFVIPLYDLIWRFSREDVHNLIPSLRIGAAFVLCAIVGPAMIFVAAALFVSRWWEEPRLYIVVSGIVVIAAAAFLITWALVRSSETDDWNWSLPWRKYILPYAIAFLVPLVVLFLVRRWVAANATPAETPFLDNPIRGESWFAGRLTAAQVVVRLWGILLWPYHLSSDYSFNEIPVYGAWLTPGVDLFGVFSAVLIGAVLLLAAARWRKNQALAFYILFYFLTYFPTSNFVLTIGSIMAERFLYLPFIGFIGVMALALEYVCRRVADAVSNAAGGKPQDRELSRVLVFGSVVCVISIVYGLRTFFRNYDWRSDVTLWQSAKDISPKSFRSYQSYAFALFEEVGLPPERRQPETKDVSIDNCIFWASKGRPIVDPLPNKFNSSRLYLHLGMYYQIKAAQLADKAPNGEPINNAKSNPYYQEAIAALERGVPVDRAFNKINRQKELERGKKIDEIPDVGLLQVYQYLGDAYLAVGRPYDALAAYQYMRHLDPTSPDGYVKIAAVYTSMNTPELVNSDPGRAAGNMEQAATAIIQALWLDSSRTFLWQPLDQLLSRLNRDPSGPVIVSGPDGRPRLNSQRPIVSSTICSAYQGFIRLFLESKLFAQADYIYTVAVSGSFPKALFDDIYKQFGRTPPPWPPPPTAAAAAATTAPAASQQPGAGAAIPKPAPRDAPGNVR